MASQCDTCGNYQYDEEEEVFWATGACMVVRASLYHHLGGSGLAGNRHLGSVEL